MKYIFSEFDGETHYDVVLTDQEILAEYWDYWAGNMIKRGEKSPFITEENCIADFCVVHWAQPLEGENERD